MNTKTTQTSSSKLPSKVRKLAKAELALAEKQLAAIEEQSQFQKEQFAALEPLVSGLEADAASARVRRQALVPVQDELLQLQLESLRSGGEATTGQIEQIEAARSASQEQGEIDIERFRTDSLQALVETLAPALGLRGGDTPILDRGGRVVAESQRQQGNLSSGLAAAAANARLNLPLATQQIFGAQNLAQQQVQEAQSQFESQLAQAAFQNRLALTGQTGQLGLNLSGIGPSGVGINALAQLSPRTTTGTTGGLGNTIGLGFSGLGAFGAGLTGLGAIGFGSPAGASGFNNFLSGTNIG